MALGQRGEALGFQKESIAWYARPREQLEGGAVTKDLWVIKSDSETWQHAVSRFRLYPEDMDALMAWAIEEDNKCLLGTSQVGNEFFIPAGLAPTKASDQGVQRQARLVKAEQERRDAEHDASVDALRAESEYLNRYLRPGVSQHVRDLAAVNLMTAAQLEERLHPEILDKLSPAIADAMCERYLKLEGVIESKRWENLGRN